MSHVCVHAVGMAAAVLVRTSAAPQDQLLVRTSTAPQDYMLRVGEVQRAISMLVCSVLLAIRVTLGCTQHACSIVAAAAAMPAHCMQSGKTKFTIENATKTRIVLADTRIHILGSFQNIKVARDALCSLILGSPPGKVYSKLRSVCSRLNDS